MRTNTYRLLDEDGAELLTFELRSLPPHRAAELQGMFHAISARADSFSATIEKLTEEQVGEGFRAMQGAHEAANGAMGYLLGKLLVKPEVPAGQGTPAVIGLAVYDALWDLGWTHPQIVRAAQVAMGWLGHLAAPPLTFPHPDKVREVLDFGGTPVALQTGSSPSSASLGDDLPESGPASPAQA